MSNETSCACAGCDSCKPTYGFSQANAMTCNWCLNEGQSKVALVFPGVNVEMAACYTHSKELRAIAVTLLSYPNSS